MKWHNAIERASGERLDELGRQLGIKRHVLTNTMTGLDGERLRKLDPEPDFYFRERLLDYVQRYPYRNDPHGPNERDHLQSLIKEAEARGIRVTPGSYAYAMFEGIAAHLNKAEAEVVSHARRIGMTGTLFRDDRIEGAMRYAIEPVPYMPRREFNLPPPSKTCKFKGCRNAAILGVAADLVRFPHLCVSHAIEAKKLESGTGIKAPPKITTCDVGADWE